MKRHVREYVWRYTFCKNNKALQYILYKEILLKKKFSLKTMKKIS